MNKLVIAAGSAALMSFVLTPIVRSLALRRGYLDFPNERSSHARPTPRIGGLAILAGISTGSAAGGGLREWTTATILTGGLALAAIALFDDWRALPRLLRLVLQVTIVGTVLTVLGIVGAITWPSNTIWGLLAWTLALIWLVGLVNAYNFMDGLNGIAGLAATVTGATLAALALRRGDTAAAILAISLAAAVAGFLPFNLPSGSIFMGDTGSTVLGLVLGALVLNGAKPDALPVAAVLPLTPFVLDSGTTLVRRALRGERFFSTPHRSHHYQRLQQQGWSHPAVAALYASLTLICGGVALIYDQLGFAQKVCALAAIAAVHAVIFTVIQRRWSRQSDEPKARAAAREGACL